MPGVWAYSSTLSRPDGGDPASEAVYVTMIPVEIEYAGELALELGAAVSLLTLLVADPVLVATSVTHTRIPLGPSTRSLDATDDATSFGLLEYVPLAATVPFVQSVPPIRTL